MQYIFQNVWSFLPPRGFASTSSMFTNMTIANTGTNRYLVTMIIRLSLELKNSNIYFFIKNKHFVFKIFICRLSVKNDRWSILSPIKWLFSAMNKSKVVTRTFFKSTFNSQREIIYQIISFYHFMET